MRRVCARELKAARKAYASRSAGAAAERLVGVMDVEAPMLQRIDGHMDPLHYCLPGPPDFYSHVLYNFVL